MQQDDSALNRKVLVRILNRAEQAGELRALNIREADDGATAVQAMQEEMNSGGGFDIVLLDNVMVSGVNCNSTCFCVE